LSTTHTNTPIENRVNNKWQQQLGENYLEHVKIFEFKKRTSCRLFVCLFDNKELKMIFGFSIFPYVCVLGIINKVAV